jgi:hypothetical protein
MSDIRAAMELSRVVSEEFKGTGRAEEVGRQVVGGAANAATSFATGSPIAGTAAGIAARNSVSSETAQSVGGEAAGFALVMGVFAVSLVATPFVAAALLWEGAEKAYKAITGD